MISHYWLDHIIQNGHLPVATSLWIAVNVGVFLFAQDASQSLVLNQHTVAYKPWTSITYSVFHKTTDHLVPNMIMLAIVGSWYEYINGFMRTLMMILITALVSGLTHVMYKCLIDDINSVKGASGSVFGLLTAPVASLVMNWSEMQFAWFRLVYFASCGVAIVIVQGSAGCEEGHIAGACTGFLWGLYEGENMTRRAWEWWVSAVAVATVFAFVVCAVSLCWETWPIACVFTCIAVPNAVLAKYPLSRWACTQAPLQYIL